MKRREYSLAELRELLAAAASRQQAEAGDPAMLRERLRAGRASAHEQAFLADFLGGKLRKPAGRPTDETLQIKKHQSAFFFVILTENIGVSAKVAYGRVAEFFGTRDATLRDWVDDEKRRAGDAWPALVSGWLEAYADLRPALLAEPRIGHLLEVAE